MVLSYKCCTCNAISRELNQIINSMRNQISMADIYLSVYTIAHNAITATG